MKSLRIGLDLDGVVYSFESCIRAWFEKQHPGGDYSAPATQWKFFQDWRMPDGSVQTGNEFHREMTAATAAGHLYTSQAIDPDWLLAADSWMSDGHSIHLITHRTGRGVAGQTSDWLEDSGLPYDTITYGMDKTLVNADLLVDDKPENVTDWTDATGKPGLIYNQSYNQGFFAADYRVYSPQHLDGIIAWLSRDVASSTETILQEAQRLVHGDRGADYGHPVHDFGRTAALWNALFAEMLQDGYEFGPRHIPMAMMAVKMSREVNRSKRDNRTDIAGYAETLNMVEEYVG